MHDLNSIFAAGNEMDGRDHRSRSRNAEFQSRRISSRRGMEREKTEGVPIPKPLDGFDELGGGGVAHPLEEVVPCERSSGGAENVRVLHQTDGECEDGRDFEEKMRSRKKKNVGGFMGRARERREWSLRREELMYSK